MSDTLFLFFDRFEEVGRICWFGSRWQAAMLAEVRVATRAEQDIVSPSMMPVFGVWKKEVILKEKTPTDKKYLQKSQDLQPILIP